MVKQVVVLGGGIGGLSAAHELASRGYSVRVFEAMAIPGGKARSVRLPGTGTDGRPDLPGEHGFRFFPGFYKHITDSMKRIPYPGNVDGVFDNLVQATQFQIARINETDPVLVARFPRSLAEFKDAIVALATANFGIPELEAAFFGTRLVALLSSCDERRFGQWEHLSWWDFIEADKMSQEYKLYLARGLTRSLVAMRAEIGSTRTVGYILLQLLQDLLRPGETLDRLLDGPTNDVFIDPWVQHIQQLGVDYQLERPLHAIHMSGGRISSVDIARPDGTLESVTADHYVSAIPVDRFVHFLTPDVLAADPSLGNLSKLQTAWMNGIQFYLRDDVPLAHGHTIYVESPWALTSISQQQFWKQRLSQVGDGTVRGILSVDISDWESPGFLLHKPADTIDDREQIMEEVWEQLRLSLNDDPGVDLMKSNLAHWYLDDSIVTGGPSGKPENREPLLVNTVGSWADRPEAHTAIGNLFLASDYVRTYTDLATMEGANEAARRAVNAILDADHDPAERCALFPLEEPLVFEPLKLLDKLRWRLGLPPLAAPDLVP
ncbi:MAG: FAD-dependent oxidoreductase [Sandaracinaceae bacterium]|nr:FAD-dependent oxidoreductase [Sandaracinaceae bacterium]